MSSNGVARYIFILVPVRVRTPTPSVISPLSDRPIFHSVKISLRCKWPCFSVSCDTLIQHQFANHLSLRFCYSYCSRDVSVVRAPTSSLVAEAPLQKHPVAPQLSVVVCTPADVMTCYVTHLQFNFSCALQVRRAVSRLPGSHDVALVRASPWRPSCLRHASNVVVADRRVAAARIHEASRDQVTLG